MQVCRTCKTEKTIDEYYKNSRYKSGKDTICKDCSKKLSKSTREKNTQYYNEYDLHRKRNNIRYIFIRRYSSLKFRVSRGYMGSRGSSIPSREEFMTWCYSKQAYKQFKQVYSVYKQSGFKRSMIPTIDRIDNSRGYTVDNIQWLSHSDNVKKMYVDYGGHPRAKRKDRILQGYGGGIACEIGLCYCIIEPLMLQ